MMKSLMSIGNIVALGLVLLIWLSIALIVDLIMRALYLIKLDRYAVAAIYHFSQVTMALLRVWGTRIHFEDNDIRLEENRPIIFVCSHHSSLDILLLVTQLFKPIKNRRLGFISRPGLDRGIPAISLYLRKYCYSLKGVNESKLIVGESDQQLLPVFARRINDQNDAVVVFPEGVKPIRDQEYCRRFNRNGLRILLENMPDALLVPIAIKGSADFYTTPRKLSHVFKHRPSVFTSIKITLLPAINGPDIESQIDQTQNVIFNEFERLGEKDNTQFSPATEKRKWTL